jgi:predicted MFS family arabinose efflux permease
LPLNYGGFIVLLQHVDSSARTAPVLSRPMTLLLSTACGLAVANVYYAQPLLDAIATEFGANKAYIGSVITWTQIGYGVGLIFLVPLGDLLNRRQLITGQMLLSVLALIAVSAAKTAAALMCGLVAVGVLAVVTQTLVAYASALADDSSRGRIVGIVTSGVVLGILSARVVAGWVADIAGWRAVFLCSAGLTAAVAAALFLLLPSETAPRPSLSYSSLLHSTARLLMEEPVLRARAVIALLMFCAFNVLWTPLVLPLSAPPLSLSHTAIGAFGLIGIAGAMAAVKAGRWADLGWGQRTTGLSLGLLLLSWLAIAHLNKSLWALAVGIVALDLAIQAIHVTNQSLIYAVRPEARSRLTACYMVFYSIGSAVGSLVSTAIYAAQGWVGVCLFGATISALALVFWLVTVDRAEVIVMPVASP